MVKLKPEWWNYGGAMAQLNSGEGWYLANGDDLPAGWLLAKSLDAYKTLEIESLGYDEGGRLKIGPELQPLVDHCMARAARQGYVNVRLIMGSRGLSCHARKLGQPWSELKTLRVIDRGEFERFISMGFEPWGLLPDIYGPGYHGVMLLKCI